MKTIGIIAGNGQLPLMAAEEAKRQGHYVAVCAIQGEAEPEIQKKADAYQPVKIGELKKLVKFFKTCQVRQAVMAGKIEKVRLFQENVKPDFDMVKVLMKTRDFKDDSLLGGIADYLEGQGIELMDSTLFFKDSLPKAGVLSRKKPSKQVLEDIRFGYKLAKAAAGLDIGQTVVVKKKAIMAIEAIEGTDEAIQRGGKLGGGKVVVVKVAKPNQDMRFDVPTVGLRTLRHLAAVKAEALAFEAGKTIFIDQADFIDRANKENIVLMGMTEENLS